MKNNWPDHIIIEQYLQGTLEKERMHEVEKRALEDPFLTDALEGYHLITKPDHGLSILQRQLHKRIMLQQENKKVFDLSWQRLSVAAAAAVMFISACVLFWMNSQVSTNRQQTSSSNQIEIVIATEDSLSNNIFKGRDLTSGQPVNGWKDYESYMRKEAKESFGILGEKGRVVVGFKVNRAGVLTDFKIIESMSEKADSLAIEIVKGGPAWKSDSKKESAHQIEFDF